MRKVKIFCFSALALTSSIALAQVADSVKAKPLANNYHASGINVIKSGSTRFGPTKTGDLYLEYEFMGRQGALDYYGYVDLPKFFGTSTEGYKGIWDGGSKAFVEIQPRLSINNLAGKPASDGLIKEWYLATNYVGDFGQVSKGSAAHNLWMGIGTDINTHSKLNLSANVYFKRTFSNYGGKDEQSWGGWRAKIKWFYPVTKVFNDKANLNYIGFLDYDFGQHRASDEPNNIASNDGFQITNVVDLSFKKVHFAAIGRYFNHGGSNKYNGGSFPVNTSGWGYYLNVGYKF